MGDTKIAVITRGKARSLLRQNRGDTEEEPWEIPWRTRQSPRNENVSQPQQSCCVEVDDGGEARKEIGHWVQVCIDSH